MQRIVPDEWNKADDTRTYTDKYAPSNETEHRFEGCVKQLKLEARHPWMEELGVGNDPQMPKPQIIRLTQGGSSFQRPTNVSGGYFVSWKLCWLRPQQFWGSGY